MDTAVRDVINWMTKPPADLTLPEHIAWHTDRGYRVISQTSEGVQLVRPKVFSFVWACLWFLCFGVGVLVYLFYYMAKQDQSVWLPA